MSQYDRLRPYQIVRFNKELKGKKASVDLASVLWLDEDSDKLCCWYPPKEEWTKLDDFLRKRQKPLKNWIKYSDITILADADDYEQGLRRLQRSYNRDFDLRSSASESGNERQLHSISIDKAKYMLKQSRSLFNNSPILEEKEIVQNSDDAKVGGAGDNDVSPRFLQSPDIKTPTRSPCTVSSCSDSPAEKLKTQRKKNHIVDDSDSTEEEIDKMDVIHGNQDDELPIRRLNLLKKKLKNFKKQQRDGTVHCQDDDSHKDTSPNTSHSRSSLRESKNQDRGRKTNDGNELGSSDDSPPNQKYPQRRIMKTVEGSSQRIRETLKKPRANSIPKLQIDNEHQRDESTSRKCYSQQLESSRPGGSNVRHSRAGSKYQERANNGKDRRGNNQQNRFVKSPIPLSPSFNTPRSHHCAIPQTEFQKSTLKHQTKALEELYNRMDPSMQDLARYMDLQQQAATESILKKIENTKRSILYDLSETLKKVNEAVQSIGLADGDNRRPTLVRPLISEILRVQFPITDHETFIIFEKSLQATNEETQDEGGRTIEHSATEKKKALVSMFRGWVGSNDTWKDCVKKCINHVLDKNVQKLYSGQGRKTTLSRKESFDTTGTYECLKDFLLKKFPSIDMNIIQYVGHHLSQANRLAKDE